MHSVTIRPAARFDAADATAVMRAAIAAVDGHYDARQLAAWRAVPADDLLALIEAGRYRVAERGGALIGGAGWCLVEDRSSAIIRCVFVHPAAHGQGVGATLLRRIERELLAGGVSRLVVPAALNAIGFYERLGFVARERVVADVAGVRIPYRRMLKQAA